MDLETTSNSETSIRRTLQLAKHVLPRLLWRMAYRSENYSKMRKFLPDDVPDTHIMTAYSHLVFDELLHITPTDIDDQLECGVEELLNRHSDGDVLNIKPAALTRAAREITDFMNIGREPLRPRLDKPTVYAIIHGEIQLMRKEAGLPARDTQPGWEMH